MTTHTNRTEDWSAQVTDLAWSCRAQCDFLKQQLKKSYAGTKVGSTMSGWCMERLHITSKPHALGLTLLADGTQILPGVWGKGYLLQKAGAQDTRNPGSQFYAECTSRMCGFNEQLDSFNNINNQCSISVLQSRKALTKLLFTKVLRSQLMSFCRFAV